MSTTSRAAYWISDDRQGSVRLTREEESHLSDEELLEAARREAENAGLEIAGGEILIGDWTE